MTDFTGWLTIINLLFVIGIPIGAFFAIKSGFTNAAKAAEARVRAALTEENVILQGKVTRLENEVAQLQKTMKAVQKVLDNEGLQIRVSNDVITLTDDRARHARTVSVRIDSGELEALDNKKED